MTRNTFAIFMGIIIVLLFVFAAIGSTSWLLPVAFIGVAVAIYFSMPARPSSSEPPGASRKSGSRHSP